MKPSSLIKHTFIPHQGNEYKPHFFRETAISIMLFFSVFLLGASFGSSFLLHKTVLGASIAANVLVDLTNETRLAYNESPLTRSATLEKAALLKGQDMVKYGYFAHDSPAGVTPWHWFKQAGYLFLYAGENLAINFTESKDINNAWFNSPLHRANMLDVNFKEIGIATVEGMYQGSETTYVVQMFGTPIFPGLGEVETSTTTASSTQLVTSSTTNTTTATGTVKGESIERTSPIKTIISTENLAVVKDTTYESTTTPNNQSVPQYSSWYEKIVFWFTRYVDFIYKGLIIVIALALMTMILVEVKKQHPKHILYGVLMLLILSIFVYINSGF
jgi:hypothetical protein